MIYTILSVIILSIVIGLAIRYIYDAVKNHKFISKGNLLYFVPITLLLFVLYAIGANYNADNVGKALTVFDYISMVKAALAATIFDVSGDYTALLLENNIFFFFAFFLAFLISIFCVYTSVIGLMFNSILNAVKVKSAMKSGCDVLVGENEYNDIYIKNSHGRVLVITDTEKSDRKEHYYANGIPFLSMKFESEQLIKRFAGYVKSGKEYNFICFNQGESNLHYIKQFEGFSQCKVKVRDENGNRKETSLLNLNRICLKIELDYENQVSIQNAILDNRENSAYVNCFSRHELLGMGFVFEQPITRHLPKEFIDTDRAAVVDGKTVNVIYIGFGKTSSAIYRAQLMNDNLATVKDGRPQPLPINYYAFDKVKNKDKTKDSNFIMKRYDEKLKTYDKADYFELIDKVSRIELMECDINSEVFMEECVRMLSVKKEGDQYTTPYHADDVFNRVFITYGNDTENIDLALKFDALLKELELPNYEIFIKSKNDIPDAIHLEDRPKLQRMISLESVFNHDTLVNDRLLVVARLINREYMARKLSNTSWYGLTYIKQASNIYSALNLRLKLNLMGYDYEVLSQKTKHGENDALICELKKKLEYRAEHYEDYLFWEKGEPLAANMLSYQEHLRWNAFYAVNGYVPMKRKDIKYDEEKQEFVKDSETLKLHACLTTYEGLNEYHRLLAELIRNNGATLEQNLMYCNTYKYDYMLIDSVERVFTDSTLKLIKLNSN